MKKLIITTLFLIAIVLQSNAQDLLKEISRTFDNGQPMFIDYLETDNLKKVKTELYNEQGEIIFSMQFNPDSGLPDGEFYDLINKGSFSNGVLNCKNCMLVEANTPSVYTYNYNKQNTLITKGDVINGRLVGEVKRYAISEDTYRKLDWESTRKYVAAGANIGFRDVKTYRTGNFKETLIDTKTYNENGVLDGEIFVGNKNGWHARLNVDNGIVKSYVSYDKNGIVIDSLFNQNKIWKRNYKFEKNSGFLVFKAPENFRAPSQWDERYNDYNHFIISFGGIIPIGGLQKYGGKTKELQTGGKPLGLDSNGLYSIHLEGMFDNIIRYDINENTSNTDLYFSLKTSRDDNLFVIIYNYLKNNKEDELQKMFKSYDSAESSMLNLEIGPAVFGFLRCLKNSHYLEDNVSNALRKNEFSKYIEKSWDKYVTGDKKDELDESDINVFWYPRIKYYAWKRDKKNFYSYITLKDFFKDFISLTDYLKACKESIDKEYTEIQEMWVWNNVTNNYDKVNFEELIQLAEQKEEKAKAEAEEQARIKLENEKKAKAEAKNNADRAERKAKEEIQNTIKSLEPWYSSERKSSGKFLKKIKESKETLIKSMNIDLVEIAIYRIPGVDDPKKTYTAYTFGNLRDLDFFKQQVERDNINLFYEDLNNMTLYFNN